MLLALEETSTPIIITASYSIFKSVSVELRTISDYYFSTINFGEGLQRSELNGNHGMSSDTSLSES